MAHHRRIFLATMLFISLRITASSEHVSTPETSTLDSFSSVTVDTVIDHIFQKYSTDYALSFEGYEHLLESLSLGMIYIDHSWEAHIRNPSGKFVDYHGDHIHPLNEHPELSKQRHVHEHEHTHKRTDDRDHTQDYDCKEKQTNGPDHKQGRVIKDKHTYDLDHTQDHSTKDKHTADHDQPQLHDHNKNDNHTDSHDKQNDHSKTDDQDFKETHNHTHETDNLGNGSIHDESSTSNSSKKNDFFRGNRTERNVGQQPAGFLPERLFNTCLKPADLLQLLSFTDQRLTKTQFRELCPLLIVQLDEHHCDQLRYKIHARADKHGQTENSPDTSITPETWLYACGAIVVISFSGLICVVLLSLLHHMFVENFLHFLVAMAVGALTGDAMLHLLPHAMSSPDNHAHGTATTHDMDGVYKGLSGLAVFYFFFLFGRIQNIASSKKLEKKQRKIDDSDSVGMTMVIRLPDEDDNMILERVLTKSGESDTHKEHQGHSQGHSHGHSHGHDELPGATGAMVWRVIVGDGIHNFSDGLAIGVAFAVSVTSGLSTSIAVLCHELPHEIGDFAVLLKKGMSIKQALGFNCLSSALSLIGVLAGVAMGNFTEIKVYILVCVAGMFIYISLVDMLPEISSNPTKNPVRHLVFTMLGICVGSGIMLTIALKEDELKQLTT
ncbi:zinc transporter ZIP10-like [Pecten maximus]|uniref:zinc transporter ZIP10-like n=1 Tax=Pecten maximus TaxID=6579 RepID=UPI001457F0D1|nr:zinc transporter ZIP10-like [Pecten maximus]XP_033733149.1 zinc transporter ZIP10-like [Pecten maximus]XP_033733150.1 zinc transporter ZIP10-like [Pecten maximus]